MALVVVVPDPVETDRKLVDLDVVELLRIGCIVRKAEPHGLHPLGLESDRQMAHIVHLATVGHTVSLAVALLDCQRDQTAHN